MSCPPGWIILHNICLHTATTNTGHDWYQALRLCQDIEESMERRVVRGMTGLCRAGAAWCPYTRRRSLSCCTTWWRWRTSTPPPSGWEEDDQQTLRSGGGVMAAGKNIVISLKVKLRNSWKVELDQLAARTAQLWPGPGRSDWHVLEVQEDRQHHLLVSLRLQSLLTPVWLVLQVRHSVRQQVQRAQERPLQPPA